MGLVVAPASGHVDNFGLVLIRRMGVVCASSVSSAMVAASARREGLVVSSAADHSGGRSFECSELLETSFD